MIRIKKNIPNILTTLNLFCGLLSIILSMSSDIELASFCIFIGMIFDFCDGLSARVLSSFSPIGKELDSLADMVTFGVAPSMIMFQLLFFSQSSFYFNSETLLDPLSNNSYFFIAISSFIYTICSAIRLAKFNIDNNQIKHFIGLPTPAGAIVIASFPFLNVNFQENILALIICNLTISFLLITNIQLLSLKISMKELKLNTKNIFIILLIFTSILLLFIFKFVAIPFIVVLYLFLSILNNNIK